MKEKRRSIDRQHRNSSKRRKGICNADFTPTHIAMLRWTHEPLPFHLVATVTDKEAGLEVLPPILQRKTPDLSVVLYKQALSLLRYAPLINFFRFSFSHRDTEVILVFASYFPDVYLLIDNRLLDCWPCNSGAMAKREAIHHARHGQFQGDPSLSAMQKSPWASSLALPVYRKSR